MFIPDPGSGSFFHPGSRGQKSTGSGSATLLFTVFNKRHPWAQKIPPRVGSVNNSRFRHSRSLEVYRVILTATIAGGDGDHEGDREQQSGAEGGRPLPVRRLSQQGRRSAPEESG
jgi:hypothetical protein